MVLLLLLSLLFVPFASLVDHLSVCACAIAFGGVRVHVCLHVTVNDPSSVCTVRLLDSPLVSMCMCECIWLRAYFFSHVNHCGMLFTWGSTYPQAPIEKIAI